MAAPPVGAEVRYRGADGTRRRGWICERIDRNRSLLELYPDRSDAEQTSKLVCSGEQVKVRHDYPWLEVLGEDTDPPDGIHSVNLLTERARTPFCSLRLLPPAVDLAVEHGYDDLGAAVRGWIEQGISR